MNASRLDPVLTLLASLSLPDLLTIIRRRKLSRTAPPTRLRAIKLIACHFDLAETVAALQTLLSRQTARDPYSLVSGPPVFGETEILSPDTLRLAYANCWLPLKLSSARLFLENLWPILASAPAPGRPLPGRTRPPLRLIDAGDYELRAARLRLKLRRAGLLSFRVELLRQLPQTRRPQYILHPIA